MAPMVVIISKLIELICVQYVRLFGMKWRWKRIFTISLRGIRHSVRNKDT
jgi:hypothetical protein